MKVQTYIILKNFPKVFAFGKLKMVIYYARTVYFS